MIEVILVMPYTDSPMGGVENVAYNIVEGLTKVNKELINKDVHVTILSDAGKHNGISYRTIMNPNIKAVFYRRPRFQTLTGDINSIVVTALSKRLTRTAQVVHSHNILFTLPYALLHTGRSRIIHNFHGLPWNEFKAATSSLVKTSYLTLSLRLKLLSILPSIEYVAVSKYVLREVRAKLRIDEHRIHIIPDPVSEEFFNIKKHEIPGILFYPARLIPRKNHLTLLKALRILKEKGLRDIKLILTGRPEDKRYFNLLIYTIQRYDLYNNVILRGIVNKAELRELYSIASVVVMPSLEESFSLAVAEAMATGTPVLTSPTGLAADEIENLKNGILINPLDPHDIAEKIRVLLEDDALRGRIGMEAKRTAIKWKSDEIARRLIEFWLNHE